MGRVIVCSNIRPRPTRARFMASTPHAANASVAAAAERSAQFSLPLLECGCNPLHCFGRRRDQTAGLKTNSIYILQRLLVMLQSAEELDRNKNRGLPKQTQIDEKVLPFSTAPTQKKNALLLSSFNLNLFYSKL
jgi:hypothetical protein